METEFVKCILELKQLDVYQSSGFENQQITQLTNNLLADLQNFDTKSLLLSIKVADEYCRSNLNEENLKIYTNCLLNLEDHIKKEVFFKEVVKIIDNLEDSLFWYQKSSIEYDITLLFPIKTLLSKCKNLALKVESFRSTLISYSSIHKEFCDFV